MKRFIGTVKRTSVNPSQTLTRHQNPSFAADSPEATAVKEVCAFCEKGQVDRPGDEFLHLPAIVEAAESTPAAAQAAARQIHKYLSKPNTTNGVRQYNSIMLVRILTDNPGPVFTRNIDSRFVASIKDLLRDGRDMSVQQILRETLEHLATTKSADENLGPLLEMWRKEKEKFEKNYKLSPLPNPTQPTHDYFVRQHRNPGLPEPQELASRISEANSSAKLLLQMVQGTPLSEFQDNELLKEFSSRCQSASRSMQSYINAPQAPDADTMLTLIETNDKLSVALSKYHRAVLTARKQYPPPEPQPQPAEPEAANSPSQEDADNKPKGRIATRFASLRRKPTRSGRGEHGAHAVRTKESTDAVGGTEAHTTSPERRPGTNNATRGETAPASHTGTPQLPQPSTSTTANDRAAAAPTGGGYQHNSDDFQIENPFADRFSTTNNNSNNTNGTSKQQPSSDPAHGAGGPLDSTFQTYHPPNNAQPSNK